MIMFAVRELQEVVNHSDDASEQRQIVHHIARKYQVDVQFVAPLYQCLVFAKEQKKQLPHWYTWCTAEKEMTVLYRNFSKMNKESKTNKELIAELSTLLNKKKNSATIVFYQMKKMETVIQERYQSFAQGWQSIVAENDVYLMPSEEQATTEQERSPVQMVNRIKTILSENEQLKQEVNDLKNKLMFARQELPEQREEIKKLKQELLEWKMYASSQLFEFADDVQKIRKIHSLVGEILTTTKQYPGKIIGHMDQRFGGMVETVKRTPEKTNA